MKSYERAYFKAKAITLTGLVLSLPAHKAVSLSLCFYYQIRGGCSLLFRGELYPLVAFSEFKYRDLRLIVKLQDYVQSKICLCGMHVWTGILLQTRPREGLNGAFGLRVVLLSF